MNRVIELQQESFDGLTLAERPMPEPKPGQVVVRMRAASLNNRDLQLASGTYLARPDFPMIPVSDGAGDVVAVGEDVRRVAVGDRVIGTFWQRWSGGSVETLDTGSSLGHPIDGVLQQYMRFDESGLVQMPALLTYEEAATLPCAAVTAWYSLVTMGNVKPGDSVLVQGTGGVSIFAIQFAHLSGARVVVLSSSDAKLERARALGADSTVNYVRSPEWHQEVLRHTGGRGVDHVVEVGGPNTAAQSMKALAHGGQLNVIGYLGGMQGTLDPLDILKKRATLRGIPVGTREAFESMNRAIASAGIKPVIDRVFPLENVREAYEYLAGGRHFGKVVVSLEG